MADTLPPPAGIDVLEAMYTTRAMRRLKPDPIPAATLRAILDAAIRGPSGGNSQGWAFLAVQDAELKQGLERIYQPLLEALFHEGGPYYKPLHSDDAELAARTKKMADSASHLAHHMHEAPVIIVPCVRTGGRPTDISTGSSIYPAVQNLMIAARAYGIGSTLTTVHRLRQDEVRALLGIPSDWETAALIPLGYPKGRWGVAARRPVEEVAFGDRWGSPLP
ncbi:MAG: nitroreductase family protein [Dehalococcoidia bacterium]